MIGTATSEYAQNNFFFDILYPVLNFWDQCNATFGKAAEQSTRKRQNLVDRSSREVGGS